jgi:zinc-ribbon domain
MLWSSHYERVWSQNEHQTGSAEWSLPRERPVVKLWHENCPLCIRQCTLLTLVPAVPWTRSRCHYVPVLLGRTFYADDRQYAPGRIWLYAGAVCHTALPLAPLVGSSLTSAANSWKLCMKLFECQNCGQLLYFENRRCEKCGCSLGYASSDAVLLSLKDDENSHLYLVGDVRRTYRYCSNAQYDVCNWLIPAEQAAEFCAACVLNRTVPNLDNVMHQLYWKKLE